ncbi:MAG TPA: sigma-54 dependent transcriptional regulator [Candidatus Wallbacteria bacterium]|nr:MAG: Nitrogen regulation protein NR(I) [bacterium ADurb.Bin243]HPG57255.1 sigma-54 dependent transcriptional regulator [Candidatus Wallbacteria bacterium]
MNSVQKPKILVADDENTIRLAFENLLTTNNYEPILARDGIEALELFKKHKPPVCVIDIKMPGMNGLELLKEIKKVKENAFVIVVTAFADMEKTIEAMKFGAYDFLKKPFDNDNILMLIKKAYSAYDLITTNVPAAQSESIFSGGASEFRIIGNSPKMQEVYKLIGKISDSHVAVMITGESGSGKEIIARVIHANSPRAQKSFIAINCSAIPETLIESELFGHERGSFTGAINKKVGKFELASGGTLFLDEVAEMGLEMQTKFLRVLQEKEIVRVGGNEVVKVDPRIIAATNIDLEKALSEGKLREDLYHRLKVISIHIPPLRERREDIKSLVDYFIDTYNKELNKRILSVSPEVMEFFFKYDWPGNIRELKNVVESAVAICRDNTILFEHLPAEIVAKFEGRRLAPAAAGEPGAVKTQSLEGAKTEIIEPGAHMQAAAETEHAEKLTPEADLLEKIDSLISQLITMKLSAMGNIEKTDFYDEVIDRIETILISNVLKKFKGNQVKTSKFLGINRNTLRAKIEKYSIN